MTLKWFTALFLGLFALHAQAQDDPDTDLDTEDADKPVLVVPGEVRMGIHPIADGIIRQGEWATLRVTLANGADSTDATVSMTERETTDSGTQSYTRQVALPQGSRKDIQLLWRAGGSTRERTVSVSVGPDSVVRSFPVRLLGQDDVGIGVIGEDSLGTVVVQDTWNGPVPGMSPRPLANGTRTVRSGLIPVADIPEKSAGLMALDWIIWPQANPSALTPGQLDALLAWTASGGNLLVTVTDSWSAVNSSALADVLPIELIGEADGSITQWLTDVTDRPASVATLPIATALPTRNADRAPLVLALADDGRPVWTAGVFGLGSVHALTVDPSIGPMVTDVRREQLWRNLLWLPPEGAAVDWYKFAPSDMASWFAYSGAARYDDSKNADDLVTGGTRLAMGLGLVCPTERCQPVAGLNATQQPSNNVGYGYGTTTDDNETFHTKMREYLADIPGVAPLPLPWLAAFAVVYLMLIGPIDYAVLRLLGKQPWTWVTFPLMVVVFSAIALVGTSMVKGSQAIVNRYEVVDVLPGTGLWRGHTWLGIFSTKKTNLSLASGFDDAVVRPVGDGGFVQDARTRSNEGSGFYEWRAQTWSLAYVQTEWTAPNTGSVTVTVQDANTVVITNRLGIGLDSAEIRARGRYLILGALADGESETVSVPSATLEGIATLVSESGSNLPNVESGKRRPLGLFAAYPETHGGTLSVESPVGFVAMASQPYEPYTLTGLTPVERAYTVVRTPLYMSPTVAEAP
ncbi:MAG: hypothetical protein ACJATT_005653 [Myxococcota bacterium]|jgi:hypothetical protein